jgi:hypothetical protein
METKTESAEAMDRYEARVREIEAAEKNGAPWRASPFFQSHNMGLMLLPPCGCTIEGDGVIPSPIRIKFCAAHAKVR